MELKIIRKEFTENSTIGDFYIDNVFFSYCLEDMIREPGVKIAGKTAIPEGRYRVIIDQSNRFKRAMPHILDVPMFEGIRIHNGSYPKDTEGCPLLGFKKGKDMIWESKLAFNRFFDILYLALPHEEAWITIEREVA
ncbi:MAG: hypothetical protein KKF48_05665 [Nanoarchaeota archaeon]|nr:hypothetical protein [Nanoarchaeota archaeon]